MSGPLFNLIGLIVVFLLLAWFFAALPRSTDPKLTPEIRQAAGVINTVLLLAQIVVFVSIIVEWNAYAHTLGGFGK